VFREPHWHRDIQCAHDLLFIVQGRHSSISISIVGETNETEASAAARVAVFDDDLLMREQFCHIPNARDITDGFFNLTELFKLLAQSAVVGMPGKPSGPRQLECNAEGTDRHLPNE
jgi:hypothetical protein